MSIVTKDAREVLGRLQALLLGDGAIGRPERAALAEFIVAALKLEDGDEADFSVFALYAAGGHLAAKVADLSEEKSALVTALQWREQFDRRPGEGYTECFERIAEVFRRETGYMRPGKDASPQAGQSIDERQAAWESWIEAGLARARAAIAKATGSPT